MEKETARSAPPLRPPKAPKGRKVSIAPNLRFLRPRGGPRRSHSRVWWSYGRPLTLRPHLAQAARIRLRCLLGAASCSLGGFGRARASSNKRIVPNYRRAQAICMRLPRPPSARASPPQASQAAAP